MLQPLTRCYLCTAKVIQQHLVQRGPQYICFIDTFKLYDSIDQDCVESTFTQGCTKFVEILRDMHTDSQSAVRAPGWPWRYLWRGDGSSMLITLYMDCVILEVMPEIKSLCICNFQVCNYLRFAQNILDDFGWGRFDMDSVVYGCVHVGLCRYSQHMITALRLASSYDGAYWSALGRPSE